MSPSRMIIPSYQASRTWYFVFCRSQVMGHSQTSTLVVVSHNGGCEEMSWALLSKLGTARMAGMKSWPDSGRKMIYEYAYVYVSNVFPFRMITRSYQASLSFCLWLCQAVMEAVSSRCSSSRQA